MDIFKTFTGLGIIVLLLFVAFLIVSYVVNIYKLTQLDFQPSYTAEVVRIAGVVPGFNSITLITAWVDIGEEAQDD